jgi:hypothetical protein
MGQCLERDWACFHNEKEAPKRFKEAAARGHPESEVSYAFYLETGKAGQRRDTAEALEFDRRAAEHEGREGMFNYARRLQNGAGVERNVVEAVKLFRGAVDRGHSKARFTLWLIYTRGLDGVQPNPDKACRFTRVGPKHRNVGYMLEYADLLGTAIRRRSIARRHSAAATRRSRSTWPGAMSRCKLMGRQSHCLRRPIEISGQLRYTNMDESCSSMRSIGGETVIGYQNRLLIP